MTEAEEPIRNRVEASGLVTVDLAQWVQVPTLVAVDLASYLWQGWVLKEGEFRDALQAWSEEAYAGKQVALHCSTDAILPDWAWMLATSRLVALGASVRVGNVEDVKNQLIADQIRSKDLSAFRDARLVIKGCSDAGGAVALSVLIERLQPLAASVMYGEPCSTVPIWKRPVHR